MRLFRSLEAVAGASGDGSVDWEAVVDAATAATEPGSVALEPADRRGYAADVQAAHDRIGEATGLDFALPGTIEVQNRHHWIEANVDTLEAIFAPLAGRPGVLPGLTRRLNTATVSATCAYLAGHVLGQYDPLLMADGDDAELYFVHPNILAVSADLEVEPARFRRWIAFHEVTHAAEFAAAPWLKGLLERHLRDLVTSLEAGRVDRRTMAELQRVMTTVEGYAEFALDRAFDGGGSVIRAKVDQRRRDRGPLAGLLGRLIGLDLKRQQYERGRAFFEAVAAVGGTPASVWNDERSLPTRAELDAPARWLDRTAG